MASTSLPIQPEYNKSTPHLILSVEAEEWKAVALIIGTQIGAGVLSLPFAIKGLGFFWGTVSILFASILMFLTALFLLEALYVTNPNYHLFDLMEHHFGKVGALTFLTIIVLAVYGALSAYLQGMSEALYYLLGTPITWVGILLWALLSYVVFKGLKFSSTVETAAVFLMGLLFFVTFLWAVASGLKIYHIPLDKAGITTFFTAFSVAVFAFFTHLVIPEVIRITRSKMKAVRAISIAFALTTLIYVLFSLAVIGILGDKTPEVSVFGLVDIFGTYFAPIAYLIPIFTMLTSFVGVSLGTPDMVR